MLYKFACKLDTLSSLLVQRISGIRLIDVLIGTFKLKLTHLCFADDLLVVCNGDVESVKVIKKTMLELSGMSGLIPNMEKRTVFFGNMKNEERNKILVVLPFTVGKLPLISSILYSMNVYWAVVFGIPKTVVKNIDKILKGFLWCKREIKRGKAKVAWKTNIAAGKNTFWVRWVKVVKLKGRSIWDIQKEINNSWIWKTLLDLRGKIKMNVMKVLGNGKSTNVWSDQWNSVGILSDIVNNRDIYDARLKSNMSVWDVINDNI
ncbi:hypothetical protein Tco_0349374 [Tanacetum coccineum]